MAQSSATFTPGFSALFDPFNPQGDMDCLHLIVATNSSRALFTTPISRALAIPAKAS